MSDLLFCRCPRCESLVLVGNEDCMGNPEVDISEVFTCKCGLNLTLRLQLEIHSYSKKGNKNGKRVLRSISGS